MAIQKWTPGVMIKCIFLKGVMVDIAECIDCANYAKCSQRPKQHKGAKKYVGQN